MNLSVKAAAERAGVSTRMIYKWIGSGQLTHFRLGYKKNRGKIVIAERDLDEFLEDRRILTTPARPPRADAARGFKFKFLCPART